MADWSKSASPNPELLASDTPPEGQHFEAGDTAGPSEKVRARLEISRLLANDQVGFLQDFLGQFPIRNQREHIRVERVLTACSLPLRERRAAARS